ncbi:MAG: KpsF/GutQ family sugar-phosphate isomerase [Rhodospirillaceae bacterium]|nr:KpsF/GutQ family sugar-phosphate isomerase [Rhodospirillaceae bacterium]
MQLDDLATGRSVLNTEGQALLSLSDALGPSFSAAVETLSGAKGRVIITGMGKSGHIGRKIAATLSSTGTPALFVHPAEASHGDLGMIARQDVVVALSNSGETAELNDIVRYTRRFSIPLITVVGRDGSSLATNSDISIVLPNSPEACPLGLAPTTSTTMTLALGDALAVALLERSSFSSSKFQELHPGGSLGQRLITVNDIMHVDDHMPLIALTAAVSEAILVMTAKAFGCVGVIDKNDSLVGIVTDGDLRRHMADNLLELRVEDVMTKAPKSIRPNALAAEAVWIMNQNSITSLFIAQNGKPLGIVHMHDCLRAEIA